jgi:hypothetical protein
MEGNWNELGCTDDIHLITTELYIQLSGFKVIRINVLQDGGINLWVRI